jgi:hypothetical protein
VEEEAIPEISKIILTINMEHEISAVDSKCFSCGTLDTFCAENTSHLCKLCFSDKVTLTHRRAARIKAEDEIREALLKSNADLKQALEISRSKVEELATVNISLSTKVERLGESDHSLIESVLSRSLSEKSLSEVNANLEKVQSTNTTLIDKIAIFEDEMKVKQQ